MRTFLHWGLLIILVWGSAGSSSGPSFGVNTLLKKHGSTPEGRMKEGKQNPSDPSRDVVIIGSGPAGCTAAIYTARLMNQYLFRIFWYQILKSCSLNLHQNCVRAMLDPLVVAGYQPGGQLMLTGDVENFPGYSEAISGPDLMRDLSAQVRSRTCLFPFAVKLFSFISNAEYLILHSRQKSTVRNFGRQTANLWISLAIPSVFICIIALLWLR